jgi:hypothetical protein
MVRGAVRRVAGFDVSAQISGFTFHFQNEYPILSLLRSKGDVGFAKNKSIVATKVLSG